MVMLACSLVPSNVYADNGAAILVCGEALQGTNNSVVEHEALEDAKKKAVKKALARFVAPNDDPQSIFQQIVKNYNLFIMTKPKAVKEQTIKGRKLLFCNIDVNLTLLSNALKNQITTVQNKEVNTDDDVFFFIRVRGPFDKAQAMSQESFAINVYENAFQQLSFHKGAADEVTVNMLQRYQDLPYEKYITQITEDVKSNIAISVAVIGDIEIEPAVNDGQGVNSKCNCKIIMVRNGSDGNVETIGTFDDSYVIRRPTEKEAESLVLQKAAYNSSKSLSHLLVDYWQKK